jgi:hypothetical protein
VPETPGASDGVSDLDVHAIRTFHPSVVDSLQAAGGSSDVIVSTTGATVVDARIRIAHRAETC